MNITHLPQNKFYFQVVVNERRFKFIQANSQYRSKEIWQALTVIKMTGYGNIAKTKQDGLWVKYVFSLMPPPQKKKSCCAQPLDRSSLILQNNLQNIGGQFGTLSCFLRNFSKAYEPKKAPEIYFGPKSSRTIFEKRTPVYSLAAPLLGLAKSKYYFLINTKRLLMLISY